jgi:hypothetical protein
MAIDIQYTSLEASKYDVIIKFLEGKKFVWAFKSMSVWIAIYPIIINGKDTFLIRCSNSDQLEIADSFRIVNTIIKRETYQAQWLDDGEILKVQEFLKDTDKIDMTEVLLCET